MGKTKLFLKKNKYEIGVVAIIVLVFVLYFYQNCLLVDSNFLVAIATFLLAIIAYIQLKKIVSQNETQIIFHLEQEWNTKMRDESILKIKII